MAGATRDITQGAYPVGTVIRFGCIIGVGGTITCQTNGQWTQKPMCADAGPGINCCFFIERISYFGFPNLSLLEMKITKNSFLQILQNSILEKID